MNKRNKIIVSIVGITIVLLALLGITYAYYLTRIEGNTNTNSISITTADLKVEYRDGNGLITASNIMPGTMVTGTDGKTFTVENSGNTKVDAYSVALDYAYLEDADGNVIVPSSFERPEDFKITLTCTSNVPDKSCNGYSGEFDNSNIIMRTNSIDAGEIHSYKLEIYYDNPDVDQSNDMGKLLNLKVQIYGVTGTADIKGSITGVNEKNSVRLESDPKVSTIVKDGENYYYKFTGVEPGTHTLTIIDETGKELTNTNGDVVSQKIVVATGTSSGIGTTSIQDGVSTVTVPKITVTEVERVVNLTTNVDTSSETSIDINNTTSTIETFNPYAGNKNSLAYHIINNSINNKNGTKLVHKYISIPAQEVSKITPTGKYKESTIAESYTTAEITNMMQLYTILFADKAEEACNGVNSSVLQEQVGKYACIIEESIVFYIENYDSLSDAFALVYMEPIYDTEKSLLLEFDDLGSSYYYRGDVKDNYVDFGGMCWKIVRIVGDGSIKLILEDQYNTCRNNTSNWVIGRGNYGYKYDYITNSNGEKSDKQYYLMDYVNPVTDSDKSMVKAFYDFQNNKLSSKLNDLKAGNWCVADKKTYYRSGNSDYVYSETLSLLLNDLKYSSEFLVYDSSVRLSGGEPIGYKPTLRCTGTIINEYKEVTYNSETITTKGPMYVGTITADEAVFAGGTLEEENKNYYLYSESFDSGDFTVSEWLMLTPTTFNDLTGDYIFQFFGDGRIENDDVKISDNVRNGFRPMVTLKSDIIISGGDGTQSNPYVIN